MPLTTEQLQQFTELAKLTDTTDKDNVLKVVQEHIHPVFQHINDQGRSAANQANQEKIRGLETQLTDANSKKAEAERKLAELNGQAPDAAKLKQEYETAINTAREEAQTAIRTIKDELRRERESVAKRELADYLEELGIDGDYALTVLAEKPEVSERLTWDDQGKRSVLKKDSKEVTIVPAEGKDAVYYLAQELADTVPEDSKWRNSEVQRGSGVRKGTKTPTTGGNTSPFKAIREQEKARQATANTTGDEGISRLRGSRRAATK